MLLPRIKFPFKDELEDTYKQYFDFICKIVGFSHCKSRKKVVITEQIYDNMNEGHKKLFSSYTDGNNTRYECDLIRKSMEEWYKENCK